MANTLTGGCRCSAVRYEISAEPMMALQCQCRECQRATGGGHGSWLIVPAAATKITGKVTTYNRQSDSGNRFAQEFCPSCGSPLFGRAGGMPQGIGIHAGSLDDLSVFQPQMVVYTDRGHAWDKLDGAVQKFTRMPQMPGR